MPSNVVPDKAPIEIDRITIFLNPIYENVPVKRAKDLDISIPKALLEFW